MSLTVLPLALLTALLFGLASALQQRAAARADAAEHSGETPAQGPAVVRIAKRLFRDRGWALGFAANTTGFFVQAAALHFGSVSVVQPLLVTQLLFAVLIAAWLRHQRPSRREVVGGVAVVAALALFLATRGAVPLVTLQRDRVLLALAVGAVLGLLALAASRRGSRIAAAAELGAASGIAFSLSAVLIQLTTHDLFDRGVGATALDWVGYSLAVTTLSSQLFEQASFAAGPLPAALTAETVASPIGGYLVGVLAAGAALPDTTGSLAAIVGSAALLLGGIYLLAHSPEVLEQDPVRLELTDRRQPDTSSSSC